jgi:hypothetical protein
MSKLSTYGDLLALCAEIPQISRSQQKVINIRLCINIASMDAHLLNFGASPFLVLFTLSVVPVEWIQVDSCSLGFVAHVAGILLELKVGAGVICSRAGLWRKYAPKEGFR